jgi:hypothetical protein
MQNQSQPAGQSAQLIPHPIDALNADRRSHPRYACDGYAHIFGLNGELLFRGKILNLSLSGCLIETPDFKLERGMLVAVDVVAREIQCRVDGHIAVADREHVAGIAFRELGPRQAGPVADLIRELKETAESA